MDQSADKLHEPCFTLNNGHKMPKVGLGADSINDKEIALKMITEAGVRHIDTASLYKTEETLGEVLVDAFKAGVTREEMFITTKIWRTDYHDPVSACKQSLEKLGLEYVDLYLIHCPIVPFEEDGKTFQKIPMHKVWEGMEKCVELGLARSIGVSNFNVQLICDMLAYCKIKPVCNQVELNPSCQQPDLLKFCKEYEIVLIAYTPLGAPHRRSKSGKGNVLEDPVLNEIADKYSKTPGQIALAWNVQRGVCVIPKTSKSERALQNMESLSITLTDEEMDKINSLDSFDRTINPEEWKSFNYIPIYK